MGVFTLVGGFRPLCCGGCGGGGGNHGILWDDLVRFDFHFFDKLVLWMDRWTLGRTDGPSYRVARTHVKSRGRPEVTFGFDLRSEVALYLRKPEVK